MPDFPNILDFPDISVHDGSGAAKSDVRMEVGNISPTASYEAGGFEVDLSARFSDLFFVDLAIETPSALKAGTRVDITRKTGADAGKFQVKLVRARYDRSPDTQSAVDPPTGVTIFSAGTPVATVAELAHTHGPGSLVSDNESAHTHAPGTLGVPNHVTQGDPDASVGGPSVPSPGHEALTGATAAGSAHGHGISGASAAGSSHSHTVNHLYSHGHTPVETDMLSVEIALGTNLSSVVFRYFVVGTRK